MNSLRFSFLLLFSSLAFGQTVSADPSVPVLGGYRVVPVTKKSVQAAANFAVEEHAKVKPTELLEIIKAKQQVVAGMNYKLTLEVWQGQRARRAVAVVYVNLGAEQHLTEWRWLQSK